MTDAGTRPGRLADVGDSGRFDHRLVLAGDSALLVEFAPRIDEDINAVVIALSRGVRDAEVPGVRDVVPAFSSLAVHFDPLRTDADRLVTLVEQLATAVPPSCESPSEAVRVPVCYGGEYGPDLEAVSALTGLDQAGVIDLHSALTYRVFMIGFSPGFPYLGVVDERIRVARRTSPRLKVAAGSVGLAGPQTGIYPVETPGGWNIIGRTPLRLFDPSQVDPCLLHAGSHVRFYPITPSEYAGSQRCHG